MHSHVVRMSLVCTRVSCVCHSYVLVCHPYVTRMYSYVIRMSLACTRMSSVCHSYVLVCYSYVLVCHPYVTRMYLCVTRMYSYVICYVTRMYLYVIRMSLVCDFTMNPWIQVASYNNSWEICQHAIIKLSVAYSFRRMFFIGQNLKHVLMTYSFLKLLIFFLLTLIQKYKYSLFGAYFSPHQRNIVCK